ncbi:MULTISPECIES: VIT1/CCC1 transporter family protein [Pantoea]|uniref:VIT family protein n=2 Tax=Pantoea stewartii TaxID=66269 RepID=H3RAD0_PANSE|nr:MULTISPECIES: VIT family protein [Pantoea]KKW51565.1 membrane protein [Pantoea ananatis]ARF51575.1 hypothetical protein DSJ_21225 [Pantoea stewartii subsp. stewartii DC283]EHU02143.1 VIT family protein [Pantoea stewartii subsp. stewartii DC283]KAB0549343.1 VIT family protein [Pantoea stewartii subsp. stewartii]KGD83621.1 membrane protein [Pantoea stewartii subsp. indologenes]
MQHSETHKIEHAGWLRAAVLGANDGIVSTASLLAGVVSASSAPHTVLLAGLAGIVGGAMSMATGEYVSVSSQSDSEQASLQQEKAELEADFAAETVELTAIYQARGLSADLAHQVAEQLMAHDALAAHARDELGITDFSSAKPLQAALFSAISFASGSVLPFAVALLITGPFALPAIALSALLALALLGALAAKAGDAPVRKSIMRICFWSLLAMSFSATVGYLTGQVLG